MRLIHFLLLLASMLGSQVSAKTITDLAGREVALPDKVERIILGESRYIRALAILQPDDPVAGIVGMLPDFEKTDPAGYEQYTHAFPSMEKVPLLGRNTRDTFSVEQALNLLPDVAIFSLDGHGPGARDARLIAQLEAAGIAVVFIDFRDNPIENTPKSMAVLGEIFNRQSQAESFIRFYLQRLAKLKKGLETIPADKRPSVFLHSRVGFSDTCCGTMSHGMLGDFITYLGANNIAAEKIPGISGVMNREYLLVNQPDIYIATAIGTSTTLKEYPQFIALGAGISKQQALDTFDHVLSEPWYQQLEAVQQKRAYAIWHHFYNSPFNIAALEQFAKWLYPETFSTLNPDHTLATLFERFQPIPLKGSYWIQAR
jgi:iron complex transport system substrate-binding protein